MTLLRTITKALSPAALALGLALPRPAWAEDNHKRIAAEALFEEGTKLMAEGRYQKACAKFEASQALDAGIGTLLFLGDCYEQSGRSASAWATFREAESLAHASGQSDRAQVASARARALERRLSSLSIVVPREHHFSGLTVTLEGQPIPPASYDQYLPIDPGQHRIVVSAPGHRSFEKTLTVAGDAPERYRMVVPLLKPIDSEHEQTHGSTLRTAGLVSAGAGVLTMGAGAVLGVIAARKNDQSLDECPEQPDRCTPRGVALREDAQRYADWSTVGFAAGGGLIVTGVVLYIAAPSSAPKEKPTAAKLAELRVAPAIDTRRLGLTVKGRF
jgi:serine/threonine-protein kinase